MRVIRRTPCVTWSERLLVFAFAKLIPDTPQTPRTKTPSDFNANRDVRDVWGYGGVSTPLPLLKYSLYKDWKKHPALPVGKRQVTDFALQNWPGVMRGVVFHIPQTAQTSRNGRPRRRWQALFSIATHLTCPRSSRRRRFPANQEKPWAPGEMSNE
jgi:hypothetical protein